MAEERYGCSAVVTLRIRVHGKGHWGPTATVAEVQKRGGQETIDAIKAAFHNSGMRVEFVGEPFIGAITWGPPPPDKD